MQLDYLGAPVGGAPPENLEPCWQVFLLSFIKKIDLWNCFASIMLELCRHDVACTSLNSYLYTDANDKMIRKARTVILNAQCCAPRDRPPQRSLSWRPIFQTALVTHPSAIGVPKSLVSDTTNSVRTCKTLCHASHRLTCGLGPPRTRSLCRLLAVTHHGRPNR